VGEAASGESVESTRQVEGERRQQRTGWRRQVKRRWRECVRVVCVCVFSEDMCVRMRERERENTLGGRRREEVGVGVRWFKSTGDVEVGSEELVVFSIINERPTQALYSQADIWWERDTSVHDEKDGAMAKPADDQGTHLQNLHQRHGRLQVRRHPRPRYRPAVSDAGE